MPLERDVSRILDQLGSLRDDPWGHQATRMANGIRESGIVDEVGKLSERVESSLFSLAVTIGAATQSLAAYLVTTNGLLSGIDVALQNPQAMAADEFYRRGVRALANTWLPEAVQELSQSVTTTP